MAWCPFAVHKPLSENHTQGSITPRAVILHTAVSASDSLFNFFQHNSDLESHFYVSEEGVIEQYMDTQIRADANKNANSFAVSIETEDGRKIREWTPVQLQALIRLVTWICDTHGIPKRQIPNAYGSGIGWHVQFGAPGPWTPVSKSCPGAPRIAQTRDVLIPAVANGGGGGGSAPPARTNQEDLMAQGAAGKGQVSIPTNGARSLFCLVGGKGAKVYGHVYYIGDTPAGTALGRYLGDRGVNFDADRPGPVALPEGVRGVTLFYDASAPFTAWCA
jgi:hypothetical protein